MPPNFNNQYSAASNGIQQSMYAATEDPVFQQRQWTNHQPFERSSHKAGNPVKLPRLPASFMQADKLQQPAAFHQSQIPAFVDPQTIIYNQMAMMALQQQQMYGMLPPLMPLMMPSYGMMQQQQSPHFQQQLEQQHAMQTPQVPPQVQYNAGQKLMQKRPSHPASGYDQNSNNEFTDSQEPQSNEDGGEDMYETPQTSFNVGTTQKSLANTKNSILALSNSRRTSKAPSIASTTRSELVRSTQQRYTTESRPEFNPLPNHSAEDFRSVKQRDLNTVLGGLGFDSDADGFKVSADRKAKQSAYAERVRQKLYERQQEALYNQRQLAP